MKTQKTVKVKDLRKPQSFKFNDRGLTWKTRHVAVGGEAHNWGPYAVVIESQNGTTRVIPFHGKTWDKEVQLVGCEWCGKTDDWLLIEDFNLYDGPGTVHICEFCKEDYLEGAAAEAEAEAKAERMASLAFHFPGDFGPHAGPDPDDQLQRHLEDIYWDEARMAGHDTEARKAQLGLTTCHECGRTTEDTSDWVGHSSVKDSFWLCPSCDRAKAIQGLATHADDRLAFNPKTHQDILDVIDLAQDPAAYDHLQTLADIFGPDGNEAVEGDVYGTYPPGQEDDTLSVVVTGEDPITLVEVDEDLEDLGGPFFSLQPDDTDDPDLTLFWLVADRIVHYGPATGEVIQMTLHPDDPDSPTLALMVTEEDPLVLVDVTEDMVDGVIQEDPEEEGCWECGGDGWVTPDSWADGNDLPVMCGSCGGSGVQLTSPKEDDRLMDWDPKDVPF